MTAPVSFREKVGVFPLQRGRRPYMSSRAEEFHLRALPEPYVNLSIHTAPDVRPLPCHSCQ
jgi:hypothetical protein